MEDHEIVNLYWARDKQALTESQTKFGGYLSSIARNILCDWSDAEECVNDTWLRAWNTMPPRRPSLLSAYLGKITRNLSFDRYRQKHRKKRGGHTIDLVLDELADCVSGKEDPEADWLKKELKEEINRFLMSLPEDKRYMFILRYWYADPVKDIARRFGMTETNVSVSLGRIRKNLRTHLEERGYDI